MTRFFVCAGIAVLFLAAIGCERDAEDTSQTPTVIATTAADRCEYEITEDGETRTSQIFPPDVYPSAVAETASGLTISLSDPASPTRDLIVTVPPCKVAEATEIIETRQAADREQAEAGIPFDEREYP